MYFKQAYSVFLQLFQVFLVLFISPFPLFFCIPLSQSPYYFPFSLFKALMLCRTVPLSRYCSFFPDHPSPMVHFYFPCFFSYFRFSTRMWRFGVIAHNRRHPALFPFLGLVASVYKIYTSQNVWDQKDSWQQIQAEGVEKREPLVTVGGIKN